MKKKIIIPLLAVSLFLISWAAGIMYYGGAGKIIHLLGKWYYEVHPTFVTADSLRIADKKYVDDQVATAATVGPEAVGNQISDSLAAIPGFTFEQGPGIILTNRSGTDDTTNIKVDTNVHHTPAWYENLYGHSSGGGVTSVSGTTNRITSTGGATPAIDISSSWVGQTSITTLGTVATGVWQGTAVASGYGGTGFSTYATGDMIYASATNTLSKLSIGTTAQRIAVVSGVPAWRDTLPIVGVYALLASPTFTGTPSAPTASTSTNTTQIATTAFVQAQKNWNITNAQASFTSTGVVAISSIGQRRNYINPASALTSCSFDLPSGASDGDEVCIYFGGTITSGNTVVPVSQFSVTAAGGASIVQSTTPTGPIVSGDFIKYTYHTANTTWYREK